jgi:hypothetical protein
MLMISLLGRGVVVGEGAADCDEQSSVVARSRGRVALTDLPTRWSRPR